MTAARTLSPLDHLRALAANQRGVFLRKQALALGWTSAQIATEVRRGTWLRLGHGVLCLAEGVGPQVHELRRAAGRMLVSKGDLVASHQTAGVVLGLPYVEPLARPVLTRHREGAPDHLRNVLTSSVPPAHRLLVDRTPVTTAPRTLVDLLRTASGNWEAQALADGALRQHLVAGPAVQEVLDVCAGWPGIVQATDVWAFADPRCESPLESRARWWFRQHGLPAPEPQFLIGAWRVDFCWPQQRVVVECDGRVKYDDPRTPGDTLWAEKRREDGVRAERYEVVRVVWDDSRDAGASVCRRIAGLLAR